MVSGYTTSSSTRTCKALASCFAVILTDSVNSIVGFTEVSNARATAEAPATAIRRTLVGGYEVFARFTSGNGLPLLATIRRGSDPLREPAPHLCKGVCLRRMSPLTSCGVGFQFFMHNSKYQRPMGPDIY
jgi:hypothetical protein